MKGLLKAIINVTLNKFVSIIGKRSDGIITEEQASDLIVDLVNSTVAEASRNTRAGFVTDN